MDARIRRRLRLRDLDTLIALQKPAAWRRRRRNWPCPSRRFPKQLPKWSAPSAIVCSIGPRKASSQTCRAGRCLNGRKLYSTKSIRASPNSNSSLTRPAVSYASPPPDQLGGHIAGYPRSLAPPASAYRISCQPSHVTLAATGRVAGAPRGHAAGPHARPSQRRPQRGGPIPRADIRGGGFVKSAVPPAQTCASRLVDEPWCLPPGDTVGGELLNQAFRASGLELPRASVVTGAIQIQFALMGLGPYLTTFPYSILRIQPTAEHVQSAAR